jgi:hypothetical protein
MFWQISLVLVVFRKSWVFSENPRLFPIINKNILGIPSETAKNPRQLNLAGPPVYYSGSNEPSLAPKIRTAGKYL